MPTQINSAIADGDCRGAPLLPGLSCRDTAVVDALMRLVDRWNDGDLDGASYAWFLARLMCSTDLIVWLAQDQDLLDDGLDDLIVACAGYLPEPWAGFLRWCGDRNNLEAFQDWPPYASPADGFCTKHGGRGPRNQAPLPSRRERRAAERGRRAV